jgi:hypothetical protein
MKNSKSIILKGEVKEKGRILTWDAIGIKHEPHKFNGIPDINSKEVKGLKLEMKAGKSIVLGVKCKTDWFYFPVQSVNIRAANTPFVSPSFRKELDRI